MKPSSASLSSLGTSQGFICRSTLSVLYNFLRQHQDVLGLYINRNNHKFPGTSLSSLEGFQVFLYAVLKTLLVLFEINIKNLYASLQPSKPVSGLPVIFWGVQNNLTSSYAVQKASDSTSVGSCSGLKNYRTQRIAFSQFLTHNESKKRTKITSK